MSEAAPAPASFFEGPFARALVPVSWLYGAAASLRRSWARTRAVRLSRPVVSVGNITCGGTGKTPAVELLARDLLRAGLKPTILSRGYGGAANPKDGAAGGNDELLVLKQNLPEVPHLQSRDRVAIARKAIEAGADVLILDDGFQHVRLARDVDFVLIDAIAPFGHGRVLPAGLLREPLEVLGQASLIGIARSDQVPPRTLSTLREYLRRRFPRVPRVELATRPIEWVTLTGTRTAPESLVGRLALAFCGIGNPEAFRRQLASLGVKVVRFEVFRDHHLFLPSDLARLEALAVECGAAEVVMTQKDAVKIAPTGAAAAWRYLKIEARVVRGDDAYQAVLQSVVQKAKDHAV